MCVKGVWRTDKEDVHMHVVVRSVCKRESCLMLMWRVQSDSLSGFNFYFFKLVYIPNLHWFVCFCKHTHRHADSLHHRRAAWNRYCIKKSQPAGNSIFCKFQIFPLWSNLNMLPFLLLICSVGNWGESYSNIKGNSNVNLIYCVCVREREDVHSFLCCPGYRDMKYLDGNSIWNVY